MSPLELMARTAYQEWIAGVECAEPKWEALDPSHRDRLISSMQAALLAVAKIDLPMSVIARAEGRQAIRMKIRNALEAVASSQ